MKKIISISRRTDIPAFYGDWFMRRMAEGFAGWENPFNRRKIVTSLKTEDVAALVFWSKSFRPFLPHLKTIREHAVPALFNYTITGMPHEFESNVVATDDAVDSLQELSRLYSPEHINWRYDPVILSDRTDEAFHLATFRRLAGQLQGHVTRCYISFVTGYRKVERNFRLLAQEKRITIVAPDYARRVTLAGMLTGIAAGYGIQVHSCCGEYLLVDSRIKKGHCVDGELLKQLYPGCIVGGIRPTRSECGCSDSSDIGCYDTCPHGCVYCYANSNKMQAERRYRIHDPESAFLGYTKAESDHFLQQLESPCTRSEMRPSHLKPNNACLTHHCFTL
jgi:hypothetical protein